MSVYFDTSYLVRIYLQDRGYQEVRDLAAQHSVVSARHGMTETCAALHRVFREGRLDQRDFHRILAQFEHECGLGAIHWIPLGESIHQKAERTFGLAPPSTFLRAADAIHLAAAAEAGFTEIYSHDRHLLAAAPLFGLQPRNIVPSP